MDIVISGATPRCGSTLVQRLFNNREKTLIWGENKVVVGKFYQIYRTLTDAGQKAMKSQTEKFFSSQKDPNLWIAAINPHQNVEKAVLASMKSFFDTYYDMYRESHDIIGYKEVWQPAEGLELLMKCYPKLQIVCLVRHPVETWKSIARMSRKNEDEAPSFFAQSWNRFTKAYINLANSYDNVYLIRYEELISRDEETIVLLEDLTKTTREEMEFVLAHKVGGTPDEKKIRPEWELDFVANDCSSLMRKLGYE